MISLENVVARMLELEKSYFALQEMYQELIHQHEELKGEAAACRFPMCHTVQFQEDLGKEVFDNLFGKQEKHQASDTHILYGIDDKNMPCKWTYGLTGCELNKEKSDARTN